MVFVDFVLIGIVVASLGWFLANKFLRAQTTMHAVEQTVEWAYCFDVHCNAFFPLFLITYVLQLCLISFLTLDNALSLLVGNTMYLVAALYYNYITFLGYAALPFLHRTVMILYPSLVFFLIYLGSLFGWHMSKSLLAAYFE